ncbi:MULTISPECIES: Ku protein [Rhodomicrobium]|uniref:non-homologous end joining protein Ku n=1 Tax=Rhodomicrobium TaxID=1068 RepID=UPI000B4C16EF|nr:MULTISPECIES: Ku protein [Rhodomicrobium]
MAPRANWKGFLKLSELSIPVALYSAATTSDRVSFHTINRQTGNRLRRQFIDEQTEQPVDKEQQVKGYEISQGEYVILEPKEIEEAIPESDKTIRVEAFLPCPEIDTAYFDKPYYLAPSGSIGNEGFALLSEGMRRQKVAALGRAVLFRRLRTVLLRADGPLIVAHTMHFDYEVRPAAEIFDDIPELKIEGEMLDLAKHIIETKSGTFDPRAFNDRYEEALAELVKAKIAGREIKAPKRPTETKVVDLMQALRESAGVTGKTAAKTKAKAKTKAPAKKKAAPAPRRKAS